MIHISSAGPMRKPPGRIRKPAGLRPRPAGLRGLASTVTFTATITPRFNYITTIITAMTVIALIVLLNMIVSCYFKQ